MKLSLGSPHLDPYEAARNRSIDQGDIARELVGLAGFGHGAEASGGGHSGKACGHCQVMATAVGGLAGYLVGKQSIEASVIGAMIGYLWITRS